MQGLADIFKIKTVSTSGYRPESNGALERTHLVLIEYLRQYMDKDDWDQMVDFATFSYNTSIHESTGFTPFELVYGHKARMPSSLPTEELNTYPTYLSELIQRLHENQCTASNNLIDTKHRIKTRYDKKTKQVPYQAGDQVYALKEVRKNELDKTYNGPYEIAEVMDKNVVLVDKTGKKTLKHKNKIKPYHDRESVYFSDSQDDNCSDDSD